MYINVELVNVKCARKFIFLVLKQKLHNEFFTQFFSL